MHGAAGRGMGLTPLARVDRLGKTWTLEKAMSLQDKTAVVTGGGRGLGLGLAGAAA
jgi:hypothetical protein